MMNLTPAWKPEDQMIKQTRLYKWMHSLGFSTYEAFYEASIERTDWFWREAEKAVGIKWKVPYEAALGQNSFMWPKWYKGGQLNITETAVDKWAENEETQHQSAVIWRNERGEERRWTYLDLQDKVNRLAAGFLKNGLQKGDVAVIYMPMLPETVAVMLAFAKVGVIFSPVFSGYGSEPLAVRIRASGASIVVTGSSVTRRGKTINMRECAEAAIHKTDTIKTVIVHTASHIEYEGDIRLNELLKEDPMSETTYLTNDDPLMILYTSGTTGTPKGAVHTHAGFPVKAAFDAGLCMDVGAGDRLFWLTDMGWMMGPFLVFGGLINGAAIVLYDGAPDYPDEQHLWSFIHKKKVTHFGLSPTFVRSAMQQNLTSIQLPHIKAIISTGEPWNEAPWQWLFDKIGQKHIPILNYSGGTEVSGGIVGSTLLRPIKPVLFNAAILGMAADVYNEAGQSVTNEVGELVVKKPWVGMTCGFWKDTGRYEDTYFRRFDGVWTHGDWVMQTEDGTFHITGRSDDVINTAGKRVGPAEIESILVGHPAVHEAAVIGVKDEVKGEALVCFIVTSSQSFEDEGLIGELKTHVGSHAGKALTPKEIHLIQALPKTRNGKIVRRLLKGAYEHKPSPDLSSLDNPKVYTSICEYLKRNQNSV
ncbi:AMP-binding protein [Bacillus pumilus]|uniref:AMP-binding protein n=1 Tax=Bacillus pumilus TaxID=1408 RepID=UPI0011E936D3|nr:AMP-binding protein [Bacillus pumilus]TYS31120.1 AMP-binding protein [Bacillus pumilus]TYS46086.1 AMP-binding protein [Bacillus pumilus]